MLAAMLDETLSPALAATLGAREFAPTLEIKVNFITPAKVGRVLGTGRIVCRGRSICFMEGQLHDGTGISSTSKVGRLGGSCRESDESHKR
jgi:acyl-coenzyme A thioesterase PaaI-like protein